MNENEKQKILEYIKLREEFDKEKMQVLKKELYKIHIKYLRKLTRENPYMGFLFEIFHVCPDGILISLYIKKIKEEVHDSKSS